VFQSTALPVPHYTGEAFAWNQINSATISSSTGSWYKDEVINLSKTLSGGNPFRNNHPTLGTLTDAGATYVITAVTGNTNNRLNITTTGGLIIFTNANTQLWTSGYSSADEPLVITGTIDPLRDVCGKRISSCRARFGPYSNLPFGSFPAAGTFYG
jgi:hypothetical protein